MRRTLPLLLAVALAVGLSATPASAHATFEQGSVPAGTDAEVTLDVLNEEAKAHTDEVTVELPEGFEVVSCSVKPGWSCTAVPAAQGTDAEPAEPVHAHSADHDADGNHDAAKDDHADKHNEGEANEEVHGSGASVTFTRLSDETVEKADVFHFTVRTPAEAGDYVFGVHQRYSNKKQEEWTPGLKVE